MRGTQKIAGAVVRGRGLGKRWGFPTANLVLDDPAVADGVYAVRVRIDGTEKNGVANAGSRPTVSESGERFLEVYLFDFEGDIYGKSIDVELVAYLRPEQKFASIDALRRQIERDKTEANVILSTVAPRAKDLKSIE